mgnify:CR=1 FL=1
MMAGVQHLQNVHPLVIHFPIAFLMGAALCYVFAWVVRKDHFAMTGFSLLLLGALSLAAAVATGLYAAQGVMLHWSVRSHLLEPHRQLMLLTSGFCAVLTLWAVLDRPFPRRGRGFFMMLLFIMLGVMTLGADFGGRMVYDYNAGGSACPQPIKFTQ